MQGGSGGRGANFVADIFFCNYGYFFGIGHRGGRWRGGRKKRKGKEVKKEREENEDLDEGGGRPSAGLCREKVTVAHTWMYCKNCNSHHLSDCIGHSERAETWQLHALAEDITSCPE